MNNILVILWKNTILDYYTILYTKGGVRGKYVSSVLKTKYCSKHGNNTHTYLPISMMPSYSYQI